MKERLLEIKKEAEEALHSASADLEALRIKYLGKKGELTAVVRGMGALSPEERPAMGALANEVRSYIEGEITRLKQEYEARAKENKLREERLDVTMPASLPAVGGRHPLAKTQCDMEDIFLGMGFSIVDGPEVELDYYNFQALNMPEGHPARDTQDTFYITDNILLRSQTSGVQIRTMEKKKPPIRIISPGRVYRSDDGRSSRNAARLRKGAFRLRDAHSLPPAPLPLHGAVRRGRRLLFRLRRQGMPPLQERGLD